MSNPVIHLKKGEGRTLKSGGSWVYDNEIASVSGSASKGAIIEVRDFDDYIMGYGFYNPDSRITVRMLTRSKDMQIDDSFFRERLQRAWDYRKKTVDTSSCRIVFGEADYLPGLVIDKYSDVLVMQISAAGMDRIKYQIADLVKEILRADGIQVRGFYDRSDGKYRDQEGLPRVKGFIGDSFITDVPIVENGVHYLVDVENGQKTGFFLDQKYNRLAIHGICKDARVLDCFTHTGSFALNAGIAGASEVTGVDASYTAIAQAEKNCVLNHLETNVRFQTADVFALLPELLERGESYDVVILDPPAFTKSRDSVKKAIKGYREINRKGMMLVRDGGYLVTCSCSHFVDYEMFTEMLRQAAASTHKVLRQVEYRTQSPDHPILWGAQESYYLKFYIFQVLNRP
jgi:23S rRNA (cytosine1962-C5)-methyltransferase